MSTVYGTSAARDRQGWFFGLTGPQVFLVVGAAIPAWLAMAVGQWKALLGLIPLWVVASALVCIPIRGWSAAQWIGVLTRFVFARSLGWSRWQSKAAVGDVDDPGEADLPGVLAGVRIHDGPPMPGRLTRPAIVQDQAARTWAATARVAHPGIGMSDPAERRLMGSGLAEMVEAASGGGQIHLVALQVRTIPDDGTERAAWVHQHARASEPQLSAQIHDQLDVVLSGAAVRTEAFLTVVVREDTIARDARRAGRGVTGRARILHGLLGEVEARLTGAIGCTAVTWLDAPALATAIRTGFEPGDAAALADADIHHRGDAAIPAGVPVAAAGPTIATSGLRAYRHGEWQSVTTTILLPRKGAVMGALARALVPSQMGERRALTVFYRPVGQRTADRSTGRAEMSAAMAAEMRHKIGRVERARDRRATDQLRETDEKLDSGRSLVKVFSALSITVPCAWSSQDYGRRLDAAVRLCGFTPLPLDGAHDAAFTAATIPLGVGVPHQRRQR